MKRPPSLYKATPRRQFSARKTLKYLVGNAKPRDHGVKLRHRFSRRAVLIGAGQTGLFGLLLWRLRQLQILDTSESVSYTHLTLPTILLV